LRNLILYKRGLDRHPGSRFPALSRPRADDAPEPLS